MPLQPYWAPTGKLLVPIGTQTLVGDIVSGAGILPGTVVTSITVITGTMGAYLELTLSQTPGTFAAGYVPSGVTNHGFTSASLLTGLNIGYTSTITFRRLTLSKVVIDALSSPDQTVSFKEDVKGWVSFKSFFPENALSLASNYHTVLGGRLYKHHDENAYRNNFYGVDYNSSVNVILNDGPGSVKSFHTLDYEGSQSRAEGIRTVEVTGVEYAGGVNDGRYFFFEESDMNSLLNQSDSAIWSAVGAGTAIGNPEKAVVMKQYRNNILIHSGLTMLWDNNESASTSSPSGGPTKGFGRRTMPDGSWGAISNLGDYEVGDIITTQSQENSVSHFNMTPKDGWYVSGIETDKQEGNIHEFIEKEGKWFNYIKGIDSDITPETDFGAFDIQGIGFLKQTITSDNSLEYQDNVSGSGYSISLIESYGWDWLNNIMEFDGPINASLQIGDIIYYQEASNTTTLGGFDVINTNEIVKFGQVTEITSNTVTMDETVFGSANIQDPTHGAFIFFAKNHATNTSSLVGYFADVKFENNSTDKIELFSVGSEITESSK